MKVIIFIVLIFIVLYLLYKFYYHNMRHINVKKNLYVDLTYKVKNMNNEYPNYLFETYYDKSVIPLKIQENRKKYANKFIRYVFEDNDIVHFLSTLHTRLQASKLRLYIMHKASINYLKV